MGPSKLTTAAPVSACASSLSLKAASYGSASLVSAESYVPAFSHDGCRTLLQSTLVVMPSLGDRALVRPSDEISETGNSHRRRDMSEYIMYGTLPVNGANGSGGRRPSRGGQERRASAPCRRCESADVMFQIRLAWLLSQLTRAYLRVVLRRLYPPNFPSGQHLDDACEAKQLSRLSRSHRSPSSHISSPTSSVAGSSASIPSTSTAPPQSTSSPQPSGHSRLSVSSLLCEDPEASGITYKLEIVQQPERAAEFGTRYLSRLPVSPPPIVQLHIRDKAGNPVNEDLELPFLVAHLGILTEDGNTFLNTVPSPNGDSTPLRLLYGTIVSSPHYLRNLQGKKGVYFLFPDVSIRWRGRYRLSVSLMRLSRQDNFSSVVGVGGQGTVLTEVRTTPFEVIPYSNYTAPPQTQLSQYFVQQGARMYTFSSSLSNPSLQSPAR